MPSPTCASLSDWLRESHLVGPEQAQELRRLQGQVGDPGVLLQELGKRGWLTAFQVEMVAAGLGDQLLLGPYRLLDVLGQGAMGIVFKARQARTGRLAALKIIHKEKLDKPKTIERFQREAVAASQLNHPNIVRAFDADQVNQRYYLAMELVEGIDLARLVKQSGPLPVAAACEYVRQAALGLQHACERGVVHRDVKPSNLLLTKTAEGSALVKILDFGLARFESESDHTGRLTQLGNIVGTVDYIAPEQADNARTADIRADIYSLGCSLYFLLAAQPPFGGQSAVEKLSARMMGEPPRIRLLRPDVPAALEAVLVKMMARAPGQRYPTPAETAAALAPFARGAVATAVPVASVMVPSAVPVANAAVPAAKTGATWDLAPAEVRDGGLILAAKPAGGKIHPRIWIAMGAGAFVLLLLFVFLLRPRPPDTKPEKNPAEPPPTGKAKDKPPPRPIAAAAGYFARTINHQAAVPLHLFKNHALLENGREIGSWNLTGDRLELSLPGGKVVLTRQKPNLFSGKSAANQVWELRKITTDWVRLFNGKDLAGWLVPDQGKTNWRIDQGVLICQGPVSRNHLVSERGDYTHFHLRFQARIQPGGLHRQVVRGQCDRDGFPRGYATRASDVLGLPEKTGSLFLVRPQDGELLEQGLLASSHTVPAGEWFTQEVIADGNRIEVRINNKKVVDYVDAGSLFPHGHIILLAPQQQGTRIDFKNIEIRELTPWIPLFDGKTAAAWKQPERGSWSITDGLLIGEADKGIRHLVSARATWEDFHLVLEAKVTGAEKGGSLAGLSFRAKLGDHALPDGYWLALGSAQKFRTGTLFKLSQNDEFPEPFRVVQKFVHAREAWFRLELLTQGPIVKAFCNGQTLFQFEDREALASRGHVILSVRGAGGSPVTLAIRRLEIRELP